MAGPNKWTKGVTPNQPVSDVARRAVRARLKSLWHYASLAAKRSERDIEYVHQFRVATRRARAALRIFGRLLPEKETRRMKKELRRFRRAAGDARDLDVLGNRLARIAEQNNDGALDAVLAKIATERDGAQRPLIAAYKNAKRNGFKQRCRRLVKRIQWQGSKREPQFGKAAKKPLRKFVNEFFKAAMGDLSEIESLHQTRICGKQLRYGIDLLSGAFDESLRKQLSPVFAEVQDKLGVINDHSTAIAMLTKWSEHPSYRDSRDVLAEVIANEEHELDKACQAFRDWWTADRAAQLRRQFDDILSGSTDETIRSADQCLAQPASHEQAVEKPALFP